jgi:hypothetical protein
VTEKTSTLYKSFSLFTPVSVHSIVLKIYDQACWIIFHFLDFQDIQKGGGRNSVFRIWAEAVKRRRSNGNEQIDFYRVRLGAENRTIKRPPRYNLDLPSSCT